MFAWELNALQARCDLCLSEFIVRLLFKREGAENASLEVTALAAGSLGSLVRVVRAVSAVSEWFCRSLVEDGC